MCVAYRCKGDSALCKYFPSAMNTYFPEPCLKMCEINRKVHLQETTFCAKKAMMRFKWVPVSIRVSQQLRKTVKQQLVPTQFDHECLTAGVRSLSALFLFVCARCECVHVLFCLVRELVRRIQEMEAL